MSVNISYHSYYCTRALRVDRANKHDIENDRRCFSARENDLRETVVLPPPPAPGTARISRNASGQPCDGYSSCCCPITGTAKRDNAGSVGKGAKRFRPERFIRIGSITTGKYGRILAAEFPIAVSPRSWEHDERAIECRSVTATVNRKFKRLFRAQTS